MSNTIGIFKDEKGHEMYVTAFVGKKGSRNMVQLTFIEQTYIELSQKQISELICMLTKRVTNTEGFNATDSTEPVVVNP